jgi:hypothetical protein
MSQRTRIKTALLFAGLGIASAAGCARTVLVEENSLLRVGRGAELRVWYHLKGEWVDSEVRLKIPEGWYLVPPSFVSEDDPLPSEPRP